MIDTLYFYGSLAQSVEQRTFNPLVEGSNPSRPTNIKNLQRLKLRLHKNTKYIIHILFKIKKITALSFLIYSYLRISQRN